MNRPVISNKLGIAGGIVLGALLTECGHQYLSGDSAELEENPVEDICSNVLGALEEASDVGFDDCYKATSKAVNIFTVQIPNCDDSTSLHIEEDPSNEVWTGTWTGWKTDACYLREDFTETLQAGTLEELAQEFAQAANECTPCKNPRVQFCVDTFDEVKRTLGWQEADIFCSPKYHMSTLTYDNFSVSLLLFDGPDTNSFFVIDNNVEPRGYFSSDLNETLKNDPKKLAAEIVNGVEQIYETTSAQ